MQSCQAKHCPPAPEEAQHPYCTGCLGNNRCQRRPADAHVHRIDHQRIQRNIQDSTDENRSHTNLRKTLGTDEGIHSQADQNRYRTQHIDPEISHRGGNGLVIPAQPPQRHRRRQVQQSGQEQSDQQKHRKGGAHDSFRFPVFLCAPRNGCQGGSAGGKEIGKGSDQRNQRKTDTQAGQRQCSAFRHMADIHSVHNVVKHVNKLSQHHGQAEFQDDHGNLPLGKVAGYRSHAFTSVDRVHHVFLAAYSIRFVNKSPYSDPPYKTVS